MKYHNQTKKSNRVTNVTYDVIFSPQKQTPVAGGWAGAVMSWAGAVMSWAGAVMI